MVSAPNSLQSEKAKRRFSLADSRADEIHQHARNSLVYSHSGKKLIDNSVINCQLSKISEAKQFFTEIVSPAEVNVPEALSKVKVLLEKELPRSTKIKLLKCTKQIIKKASWPILEKNLRLIEQIYEITVKLKKFDRYCKCLIEKLNEINAHQLLQCLECSERGVDTPKHIILCHHEYTSTYALLRELGTALETCLNRKETGTAEIFAAMVHYLLEISISSNFSDKEKTLLRGIAGRCLDFKTPELETIGNELWEMLRETYNKRPSYITMMEFIDFNTDQQLTRVLRSRPENLKKLIKTESVKYKALLTVNVQLALNSYHFFFNTLQKKIVDGLIDKDFKIPPDEVVKFWVSLAKQFLGDPYILAIFLSAFKNPSVVAAKIDFSSHEKDLDQIEAAVDSIISYKERKKKNFLDKEETLTLMAYMIAREIRRTNIELFQDVTLEALSKGNNGGIISKIFTLFNSLTAFIVGEILDSTSELQRAITLKVWIVILTAIDIQQDLQGGLTIFSSLQYNAVSRLKRTWSLFEQKFPRIKILFDSHAISYSAVGNMSTLKARSIKRLKDNEFVLPYLGKITSDLTLAREGNPLRVQATPRTTETTPRSNSRPNIERMAICGKILQDVVGFQSKGIADESQFCDFIAHLPPILALDDHKFEALSYKIEPLA